MADLGLIRRIRRVPGGALDHVPPDDRRGDAIVPAGADQRGGHGVQVGQFLQAAQRFMFAERTGHIETFVDLDRFGDGGGQQLVDGLVADGVEHRLLFGLGRADVATGEGGRHLLPHELLLGVEPGTSSLTTCDTDVGSAGAVPETCTSLCRWYLRDSGLLPFPFGGRSLGSLQSSQTRAVPGT